MKTQNDKPILAIDPGNQQSAWLGYQPQTHRIGNFGIAPNEELVEKIAQLVADAQATVAIEMVACYGMPVGREVFETCVWIGRFIQALLPQPVRLVYRREAKLYLCNSVRAKDSNIRQALADRFGGKLCKGTKKNPGPLYGFHDDLWAALAVAITAAETPRPSPNCLAGAVAAQAILESREQSDGALRRLVDLEAEADAILRHAGYKHLTSQGRKA